MAVSKKRPAPQEEEWLDLFEDIADDVPALPEEDDSSEAPAQQKEALAEPATPLTPSQRRKARRDRLRQEQKGAKGRGKKEKPRKGTKKKSPGEETGERTAEQGPEDASGKKGKRRRPRRRRSLKDSLVSLVVKLVVIAIATYLLTQVIGGIFVAHDNNMFPAVRDGDLCITYRLGGYYNGDVVAFEYDGMNTFGRVVGIPGDVIDITKEQGLMVNGMSPYEVIYYKTFPQNPEITYPYTVQEGEWFVLCDQREDAQDSRTFGAIAKPKGKIVLQLRRRGF